MARRLRRTTHQRLERCARCAGILLSITARLNGASIQSDATEAAGQLKAAFDKFRSTIHQKDAPPDGTGATDREVPNFAEAAILVEGPSSIALTTPASTTLFASEQLSVTAQADTQLTAQHTASFVAGDAASLYTHAGGIKAIAANSPVSIQAHDGPLEILADKTVTVTSSNDSITVTANEKIVLQAGQSSITLDGANITFACPGNFTVKAGSHAMAGGASAAAELEALPVGSLNSKTEPNWIELNYAYPDLTPAKGFPYKILFDDGTMLSGKLDGKGYARHEGVPTSSATVYYGEDPAPYKAQDFSSVTLSDEALAEDLRKLGLDPDNVDLAALLHKYSGRVA